MHSPPVSLLRSAAPKCHRRHVKTFCVPRELGLLCSVLLYLHETEAISEAYWETFIRHYLVSWSQPVHGADLVRREGLAEEVDGRHLAAEHALLVHVGGGADVALVERLEKNSRYTLTLRFNTAYVAICK